MYYKNKKDYINSISMLFSWLFMSFIIFYELYVMLSFIFANLFDFNCLILIIINFYNLLS